MPEHEFFREVLAPFKLCSLFVGTNNSNMFQFRIGCKEIRNTFHQRIFGSYDNAINLIN